MGAWLVVIVKALLTPITIDEASTFIDFIRTKAFIPGFSIWEANNHLLNSALSIVTVELFGNGVFAMRLPNVLAFGLLVTQVCGFATNHIQRLQSAVALGFVMFCSPLIIDLFSLCRGYGLSFALLLWFINAFVKAINNPQKRHWMTLVVGCLMVLANLNLVSIYIAGFVVLSINSWRYKSRQLAVKMIGALIILSATLYGMVLKESGFLYFGTDDFIDISLGVTSELYTGLIGVWWLYIPMMLLASVFVFFKNQYGFELNTSKSLFILTLVSFSAPIAQHVLLDSPFQVERTFAHSFIILSMTFVYEADRVSKLSSWFALFCSSLIVWGSFVSLKPNRSNLWQNEIIPEGVMAELEAFKSSNGAPIIVSNFKALSSWEYLNIESNNSFIYIPFTQSSAAITSADYLFLKKESEVITTDYDTLIAQDEADYVLLKRAQQPNIIIDSSSIITEFPDDGQEYFNVLSDSILNEFSKPKVLNLVFELTLEDNLKEVQLVISESTNSKSVRSVFDLHHYMETEQPNNSTPFHIRFPLSLKGQPLVSVYFWNVDRSSIQFKNCELRLETHQLRDNNL